MWCILNPSLTKQCSCKCKLKNTMNKWMILFLKGLNSTFSTVSVLPYFVCEQECCCFVPVRLTCLMLSLPSPDSSLGMTVIMHMLEQLLVHRAHFAYSSEGSMQAAPFRANKPLFSCQSCDKDLGMKWGKQMGEWPIWTEGELIRHLCPQGGHSLRGGNDFSGGEQQKNNKNTGLQLYFTSKL